MFVVTLDGISGSGKSTQVQILTEKFGLTRFSSHGLYPFNSANCFPERAASWFPNAIPGAMASQKALNAYRLFMQKSSQNCWVDGMIFEHFLDGMILGDEAEAAHYASLLFDDGSPTPTISIVLECSDAEERIRRKIGRDTKHAHVGLNREYEYWTRAVSESYRIAARMFPYPIEFVDAAQSIEAVAAQCSEIIKRYRP